MALKFLFIIPPYFNIQDFLDPKNNQTLPAFTIPYGILSLESYVKTNCKKNVKFELLDLNIEAYKIASKGGELAGITQDLVKIVSERLKEHTDIVGISALFNNSYEYIESLTTAIKNADSSTLCVIGGGLASNLGMRLLHDFPLLDGVCFAEGEIPLNDLVNADNFYSLLNAHPSWMTKESLKTGKMPTASYVANLDDIPMSDYSLLDLKNYNGRSVDKQFCNQDDKKEVSIHTSRGCPFSCVFCANSSVHGKRVRFMSVERVIAEVDYMIKNFGMNVLLIEDDHFLFDKKRASQILLELSKRNIRIEFPNGMAVYAIDDEIGKKLKNAGVTTVQLAVESCSDYVLREIINKPHKASQVKIAKDILQKNGILVHAFIVLGLPGEMDEHRQESLKIIKDIGFDWVYFFIATPIVGSRLYKICIEKDYLVEKDFNNHIVSKGSIRAPGVDPGKIEKTAYHMNLDVNFINNFNVQSGNYARALPYFVHLVNKYPGHAFAHYVLARIYQMTGENILAEQHRQIYLDTIKINEEWKSYALEFGL